MCASLLRIVNGITRTGWYNLDRPRNRPIWLSITQDSSRFSVTRRNSLREIAAGDSRRRGPKGFAEFTALTAMDSEKPTEMLGGNGGSTGPVPSGLTQLALLLVSPVKAHAMNRRSQALPISADESAMSAPSFQKP